MHGRLTSGVQAISELQKRKLVTRIRWRTKDNNIDVTGQIERRHINGD
jgi:hypothetical protein